jgi:nitronate monooxygenase
VGFITAFLQEESFAACIDEGVPVLVFSFGDPSRWVRRAQSAGRRVIVQVQTLEGVRQGVDLGVDAIVAQGNEAGGHSGYLMTLPLLSMAVDIAGDIPVLAAGGIGNERALAAVLAAGADGALVGTPFMATPECLEVPDFHKDLIVASDGQDTLHTQVYDILSGAPWPEGIGERVRRNAFTREWEGREREVRERRDDIRAGLREGERLQDPEVRAVLYGQSAGMVPSVRPAAQIVTSICDGAERLLRQRAGELLG